MSVNDCKYIPCSPFESIKDIPKVYKIISSAYKHISIYTGPLVCGYSLCSIDAHSASVID